MALVLGWLTDLGVALARAGAPSWDEAALATAVALTLVAGAVQAGRAVLADGGRGALALAVAPASRRGASAPADAGSSSPRTSLTYLLSVVRR